MKEHVRIRVEYADLVRAGKLEEAQKILENIWDRKIVPDTTDKIKESAIVNKPKVLDTQTSEYTNLDDLIKIKGIGKKTVKDIKVIFVDLEDIKRALMENRVALRDDIVEKLKEVLM